MALLSTIAMQMQNPFGEDALDLPLNQFCNTVITGAAPSRGPCHTS
jgi:predicted membrane chloride channel (bestrophin family)